uniref:Ubiquitin-like domain-containing protein n=1 Tax=Coccolithus braarudii TaxID=221442 RepID=A0A7S0LC80_9EUKA|mmetsp:Transcript_3244/g.6793  ORF Transcript_3244/g.6793 Transcript_3244/m.6793 type:complete len:107 (+) Transcript_3244:128-448(+)
MSITVRLLGPDLPSEFKVTVENTATVLQVKEAALGQWEAVDSKPTVQQLRVIHHGRFLQDEKTLKDCRIPETDIVAMHLILTRTTKHAVAEKLSDDKTPKCTCLIC